MRNLTVTRRDAYAGCLSKVKIFIEDAEGDTEINGTRCRLLGKIGSGESATYEIGNESHKLFAIYDKMSKGFCNDIYIIPEGEEDIEVSGVSKLNPFLGNPFRFDGNTNEEVSAIRKQNRKKALLIMIPVLVVAVAVGFFIGFFVIRNLFNV